ncbi:MAG: hypothetical protein ACD_2C00258G0001 [uncultured bacterium (gcode 4)]|uniref:Uncharacterized protein n=1 Tax=uncultured bacterium (gcode 4) TaxID=1234023 RepID=K2FCX2_9BACT|nr:MAG: hypothetical protein ACD_2C00258G0001 [uncultured bacterium (gcode 4)]
MMYFRLRQCLHRHYMLSMFVSLIKQYPVQKYKKWRSSYSSCFRCPKSLKMHMRHSCYRSSCSHHRIWTYIYHLIMEKHRISNPFLLIVVNLKRRLMEDLIYIYLGCKSFHLGLPHIMHRISMDNRSIILNFSYSMNSKAYWYIWIFNLKANCLGFMRSVKIVSWSMFIILNILK